MNGMQNMGTQSTCEQFKSRMPLQLETSGGQGSTKLAVGGTAEELDQTNSGDEDD